MHGNAIDYIRVEPGFGAEQFLTARIGMDIETPSTAGAEAYDREFASRYAALQARLVTRLKEDPAVSDATFAWRIPGEEPTVFVEVDGVPKPAESESSYEGPVKSGIAGHEVRIGRVDINLFDVFDVPILTGRGFEFERRRRCRDGRGCQPQLRAKNPGR